MHAGNMRLSDRYLGQRIAAALGLLLALAVYLHNRSLWLDEAKLSLNFVTRNAWELLSPLDHKQVAPVGFLWLAEALFELCRALSIPVEYGLRLPSLLAFVATAYLTFDVAQSLMRSKLGALTAAAFVCCNSYMIRYATEVKQYMLDTSVALLVLAATLRIAAARRQTSVVPYVLLGAGCIWFSNIAVLFLAVGGGYLISSRFLAERSLRWLWAPCAWCCSLGVYYVLFVHGHPTRDSMLRYWHNAFLPWPPWTDGTGAFVERQLGGIMRTMLAGVLWAPATMVLFAGLGVAVARRNYLLVYVTTAPILLHLALSAAHLYPFAHRLALYVVPLAALLVGFLASEADRVLKNRAWLPPLAAVPILLVLAVSWMKYPHENEEIKEALRFIENQQQPDQPVYVHPGARYAFEFYDSVTRGLPNHVIQGDRLAWKGGDDFPPAELSKLRETVWLLFSHVRGRGKTGTEGRAMARLERLGAKVLRSHRPKGSSAYLIQLSTDQARKVDRSSEGLTR